MFNVMYFFVFVLGCVDASEESTRSNALGPDAFSKLLNKLPDPIKIDTITIQTDGFMITEEMTKTIESKKSEITNLINQIEESEYVQGSLQAAINDMQFAGSTGLTRAESNASLATTASGDDSMPIESAGSEITASRKAREQLKAIFIEICKTDKLGRWTITITEEPDITKTIHLDFDTEDSDTESTGSAADSSGSSSGSR